METLAVTDPLCGLFNRRRFMDALRREFTLARRYKTDLSCIILDLDHFKSVNDTHGHDAGDATLQEVARKLVEDLREVDVVARYGGEEFAILLPHTGADGAKVVAERVQRRLRGLDLRFDGQAVRVTASFGIAALSDFEQPDPQHLVRLADLALYRAKDLGRDRIVIWEPGLADPPAK